jgi:hypothetical protein
MKIIHFRIINNILKKKLKNILRIKYNFHLIKRLKYYYELGFK